MSNAVATSWEATVAVWPQLGLPGGLVQETDPRLDMVHHIDGWWALPDSEWRPVSARAQDGYGSRYNTFTIRHTEWRAFQAAREDELVPMYLIQSYWTKGYGTPLTAAIGDYHTIMACVGLNSGQPGFWRTIREQSGRVQHMAVVGWDLVPPRWRWRHD